MLLVVLKGPGLRQTGYYMAHESLGAREAFPRISDVQKLAYSPGKPTIVNTYVIPRMISANTLFKDPRPVVKFVT